MLTQCPHCQARFKVNSVQLSAASGMVRCGRCQQTFNALETLQDIIPTLSSQPDEGLGVAESAEAAPPEAPHDEVAAATSEAVTTEETGDASVDSSGAAMDTDTADAWDEAFAGDADADDEIEKDSEDTAAEETGEAAVDSSGAAMDSDTTDAWDEAFAGDADADNETEKDGEDTAAEETGEAAVDSSGAAMDSDTTDAWDEAFAGDADADNETEKDSEDTAAEETGDASVDSSGAAMDTDTADAWDEAFAGDADADEKVADEADTVAAAAPSEATGGEANDKDSDDILALDSTGVAMDADTAGAWDEAFGGMEDAADKSAADTDSETSDKLESLEAETVTESTAAPADENNDSDTGEENDSDTGEEIEAGPADTDEETTQDSAPDTDDPVEDTDPDRIPANSELPEALRKLNILQAGPARTALWSTGIILLVGLLILQAMYFWRDDLAQNYDGLRPMLQTLCGITGCELPLTRAVEEIEVVDREVRTHPVKPNALLVSATLRNNASFVQAYPLIRLTLSNLQGKIVASRDFKPRDYLPDNLNEKSGMEPQKPLHLTLDVEDPGKDAVGFTFEFL